MKRKLFWIVFVLININNISPEMISENYRVNTVYSYSTGNFDYKVSYSFKLMGNVIPLGSASIEGSKISLFPELLGLSRGPEPTVEKAYAYPNPCKIKNNCFAITFTKLSYECEISIYNIAGEKVKTIRKKSNTEKESWDLKDESGSNVASGLYIFYIKDSFGVVKTGKIIIIR